VSPEESKPGRLRRLGRMALAIVAVRRLSDAAPVPQSELPPRPPESLESDVDPSERTVPANRRAETLVAVLLALAGLAGLGFLVVYIFDQLDNQLLGVAIGGMLALLAAASIVAGKAVVPQETSVEERDALLKPAELDEVIELVESGGEGVSRRGLLIGCGCLAGAGALTAAATPLASLGPRLTAIHKTPWHRGRRMLDESDRPYPASEIEIGSFYTAFPEGADWDQLGAPLLLVKLPPNFLELPRPRRSWGQEAGGILAFSKICPHAGCAISLYRYPTFAPDATGDDQPAFTCPCHYSTFLPGRGGELVFGPAGRALPQLPVMIDSEGNLRAAGGFDEDVGPSWLNVHRVSE
jgi:ubiquinol-cytochrome c reductase iron-sulfur subunit